MPEDVIRWFERMFLPATQRHREQAWQPAVDVYESTDGWLVKFDLAGVRPEDVRVTLTGTRLTLEGQRRDCHSTATCCHHHMEIAYTRFERTLDLPEQLERPGVRLEFQQGMLLVWLTKEAR